MPSYGKKKMVQHHTDRNYPYANLKWIVDKKCASRMWKIRFNALVSVDIVASVSEFQSLLGGVGGVVGGVVSK